MIKIEKEHSYGILAIVAIVAIVALFNLSSTKVITTTESSIEESSDLVGEAIKSNQKIKNIHPTNDTGGDGPGCCSMQSQGACDGNDEGCYWSIDWADDFTPYGTPPNCISQATFNGWGCDNWDGTEDHPCEDRRVCGTCFYDGEDGYNSTCGDNINYNYVAFYEQSGTIKCEGAEVGDTGVVNEVEYLAVNNSMLDGMTSCYGAFTEVCTSHVTDMYNLFGNCFNFNQPIGHWDTSNVENMWNMFRNAFNFDQPLDDWDTGSVTNMRHMFRMALQFNQPIGNWNTSSVTNMRDMFGDADNFDQPLDDWDTSKVTDMKYMFRDYNTLDSSVPKFNQDISNWDVSSVTEYAMYDCGADYWQDEYKPFAPWGC